MTGSAATQTRSKSNPERSRHREPCKLTPAHVHVMHPSQDLHRMLRFEDRVVLITGAGRGIGRAHALFLASRGATVVVNDNDSGARVDGRLDSADEVVHEIEGTGGRAMAA